MESSVLFYEDTAHVFTLHLAVQAYRIAEVIPSRPFHLAIKSKIDARRELQSCLVKNSQAREASTRNATGAKTAEFSKNEE
jgi:hypothetical protein